MSTQKANKLIGRMKRTRVSGTGFDAVMSDLMMGVVDGSIVTQEANAVLRVNSQQLRKFGDVLRAERAALRKRD